jgi:hypothetical protein
LSLQTQQDASSIQLRYTENNIRYIKGSSVFDSLNDVFIYGNYANDEQDKNFYLYTPDVLNVYSPDEVKSFVIKSFVCDIKSAITIDYCFEPVMRYVFDLINGKEENAYFTTKLNEFKQAIDKGTLVKVYY